MCPPLANAQSDPFIGQLMLTAANFCPTNWVPARGQVLSIAANSTLFSLLGTTYGGDGVATFNLPDLQGRVPLQVGQGPGLSYINQGERSGIESVILLSSNLPTHYHTISIPATTNAATHSAPAANRVLAQSQNAGVYADASGTNTSVGAGITGFTGSNQAVPIRNPYLGMLWCIATNGIYPPR
ncbi:MAG: hypothetical protein EKK45_23880 [Curvibacter sp.]|nr:MAG: hypothetical protein EKK45_23880 [Curvibacter sp.]